MFGIGFPELVVILIIAFIVLGPEKIMTFSKTLGRMAGDFKKTAGRIESEVLGELKKVSQEDPIATENRLKKETGGKKDG
ncbi:MAG: twin-arginine translocase TatA/TatE family subunit [Nitrospirae bacterium]|nr:twin-arginine translocase TatA/TatE family subunit [Nitrospirota bacterium]MBI3351050.1 twin-arginine translocase TatA/TatE family subunit [Nitrospirota bacterium]